MRRATKEVLICLAIMACGASMTFAVDTQPTDPNLTTMKWTIDGVEREAAVYIPKPPSAAALPLVFAFHGANNKVAGFANLFPVHRVWPEAVVVYMQGLVTWPRAKRENGQLKSGTGWQDAVGKNNDRDLTFFDAVLATLRSDLHIDNSRIYVAGFSNGGAFAYLLWHTRGDTFAAVATVAGGLVGALESDDPYALLTPKPALQVAGEKDDRVPFKKLATMVDIVKKINRCDETPRPWGGNDLCAEYPSKIGAPVVAYFHPGGHTVPKDAIPLIVQFFKEHPKP